MFNAAVFNIGLFKAISIQDLNNWWREVTGEPLN